MEQEDSMTEELKPVLCGCGGEVVIMPTPSGRFAVGCQKCDICTGLYNTETEAITAWNTAMGAKDINVPNKGEWINVSKTAWLPEFQCSKCGEKYTYRHNFCPNCGADMRDEDVPMEYFESGGR